MNYWGFEVQGFFRFASKYNQLLVLKRAGHEKRTKVESFIKIRNFSVVHRV